MNELFDCYKYLKIPLDTLWKMRVRDRRFIIAKHNKEAEEENKRKNNEHGTTDIERYTDLAIENIKNKH